MVPDPLRMVVFDGGEADEVAQQSPVLESEAFRSVLYMANGSDVQVWWYGKLMTEEREPPSAGVGHASL
ncbi:hypothetical protein M407DRAFT_242386 [Tulasnella calospora MUT 4182]|uniref:Uncharacterized protein n=1 Tax=Tulasnella calospora MUT 4182 TaxID=1051891 RepID=A0A0C3L876_9AGAM|nr:hypothetical protein M407DRAFT_242386 [Tulasnella calospora MUT 4182]